MRKWAVMMIFAGVAAGLLLTGCAKKAASSNEAINASMAMQTVKEKTDYLVSQAKAFYNSKEFQQAVDIARYVLAKVDKDSQEAKNILEDAQAKLKEAAQKAVNNLKSSIPLTGK